MDGDLSYLAREVQKFAEEEGLFTCSNIVIGLSGGPDSVFLLAVLKELAERVEGFPKLHAVHVNHNIRSEAKSDEELAVALADKYGIPIEVVSADVLSLSKEMKRSVEDTGRIARYKAFREYISKNGLKDAYIAVAHHADDVAETVMLNLFRGSGLEGLVSPEPKTKDVIRPLLKLRKQQMISYLQENGISYAEDKTNCDSTYTRNAWRNEILPKIGEHSVKDPVEAISDTYDLLKDDKDYIESEALKAYKKALAAENILRIEDVKDLPRALRSRVIRLLWNDTFSNLTDFGAKNTKDCLEELDKSGNTRLDMPFGRIFVKAGGFAAFCSAEDYVATTRKITDLMGFVTAPEGTCVRLDIEGLASGPKTTILPNSDIQITCEIVENIKGLEYNIKSWFYPLIRGGETIDPIVKNGSLTDRFRRAGSDCSKPLGRLLMGLHVPKEARESVLYVESSGEIIWIPGFGASRGIVSERAFEAWNKANGGVSPEGFIKVSVAYGYGKEEYGSV